MPTGRSLADARTMLLDAGRIVLAADGPSGLTSRAVTDASGVAKGVLHRHFADFDAYLTALVTEEASRIRAVEPAVATSAPAAVADVIEQIFTPTMTGLVTIVITRDDVRRRVDPEGGRGIPLLGDAASVLADVLAAEREVGWIRADSDTAVLALALVGSVHLLTAGAGMLPEQESIREVVTALLAGSITAR